MGAILVFRANSYAQTIALCVSSALLPKPVLTVDSPYISDMARGLGRDNLLSGPGRSTRLDTQLRGSATTLQWSGDGTGLLTAANLLSARYPFSEGDRLRGTVVFALTTPDTDGAGALANRKVAAPPVSGQVSTEVVGLSKKVFEPTWLPGGEVELGYQFTVANMGKSPLTNIQVADNLERVFGVSGVRIQSVVVRTNGEWATNLGYTGRGADTTMLLAGAGLPAGAYRTVQLTVRLAVSQVSSVTFKNQAYVKAIDVNGTVCRDRSTSGDEPDPDKNGNPGDNDEPTQIALRSVATIDDVFVPEGFSPNDDGINDRFVVSYVPEGVTMYLRVFNRWGNTVFERDQYQNDWDGRANVGVLSGVGGQGLPVGTYFYVLTLSDGREFSRYITLNR